MSPQSGACRECLALLPWLGSEFGNTFTLFHQAFRHPCSVTATLQKEMFLADLGSPISHPSSQALARAVSEGIWNAAVKRGSRCRYRCLRYTDSPVDPVITAEQPLVSIGSSSDAATALKDPETLIYFPICWQAFLFGSVRRFDVETQRFRPDTLQRVRRAYIENGRRFLVSPQKLVGSVVESTDRTR